VPQQWNEETIAALIVIKRGLLKEENERCRAEAECRLEIKKLNQCIQAVEESVDSSKLTQVGYCCSSMCSYIRNFYLLDISSIL
jgi:hypothetical protein